MLRVAISVVLLAACGSRAPAPAWPKTADAETDGGESLSPKKSSPLAASDVADDDDDDIVVAKPADKPATKATADDKTAETSKAPTTPTVTAPDDVINLDDLVIEIDD
jgi:hypothetical protein